MAFEQMISLQPSPCGFVVIDQAQGLVGSTINNLEPTWRGTR